MTYKQIEASREVRLWIGQVIVPAIVAGAVVVSTPVDIYTIVTKCKYFKDTVTDKFKRKEKSL
ncbi:MAG: hypothetical protein LIO96_08020 [Lachnospiraceae bacterium]|nr:hypothetical protein [Lachnospiraceae bacterium]